MSGTDLWRQAALNVQVGAGLVASQPFADSPAKIPELRRQEAQGWDYYKELKGGQHFEKLSEVRADDWLIDDDDDDDDWLCLFGPLRALFFLF